MASLPQSVIDAVLAQQARKREELAIKQAKLDQDRRVVAESEVAVAIAKAELDELHAFLRNAGVSDGQDDRGQKSIQLDDDMPKPREVRLSGRDLRRAVARCAEELAANQAYFTIDDLMAKISEHHYVLDVLHPRIRASQVLTVTDGFVYHEGRGAWTMAPQPN